MTNRKTSLKWRLAGLPSADEVNRLVQQEIISKEEARGILFNEESDTDRENQIKELKRQIEFMEKVIDNLSKGNRTTITYTPTLPNYTYWPRQSKIWCNSVGSIGEQGVTQVYSVNTAKLIS